ncbi:MAG: ECF transporter S component [Leuconostoc fallax]
MEKKTYIMTVVLVAFFAAMTALGTSIRVPMPAAIGSPFVHVGNTVAILSVLLMGYRHGALAAGIGFAIFDILSGYAVEAPYYFIEIFIVGAAAIGTWRLVDFSTHKTFARLMMILLIASIAKLIMTLLHNFVKALIIGTNAPTAVSLSLASVFPTVINCVTTIVLAGILYWPLEKILNKMILNKGY